MPAYIYKCECGKHFETRHSMFYEGPVVCPHCDSNQTVKVPTAPATVLNWRDLGSEGAIGTSKTRFRQSAVPQSVRGG